jgi:hypothetical protein
VYPEELLNIYQTTRRHIIEVIRLFEKVTNFIKIGTAIQKLIGGGYTDTQTFNFFFPNKELGLNINEILSRQ